MKFLWSTRPRVLDIAGIAPRRTLSNIWQELQAGAEWVVDADLSDFFGTVDHEKLLALVNRRIADGRVLGLIRHMLAAGYQEHGQWYPGDRGTPQGG